jgi:L-ascorbate metabolism protein UlaG (beta-lactamase superfamily)
MKSFKNYSLYQETFKEAIMSLFKTRLSLLAAVLGLFFFSSIASAAEPTLKWFEHSAFEITTRTGKVILIDPWLTNPKAPKNISFSHVEAILVTHGHFDHVGEAFDLAKKYNATLIACYELTEIAKKKGVQKVQPLQPSGSVRIEDALITAVPAVHASSYADGDNVQYAGVAMGYVIALDGSATLYHAGDTAVFSDMGLIAELYSPQIAMLPIGGTFTMKPAEAAIAARSLQVHTIIPMHFDTFPALTGTDAPHQLEIELKRRGVFSKVVTMIPGKEIPIKQLQ